MARRRDDRRARRIEAGVYVVAGVSYILSGFVLRSGVLNWIVGPAWFVAWVTLITPLVLRIVGIEDPDGPGNEMPTVEDLARERAARDAVEGGGRDQLGRA